jgi:hypothetical protein
MYANLGPGQIAQRDPPPMNGVDLLYSHEYVANRIRERNGHGNENSANRIDPIGYKGGFNLYEYVSTSPLTRTDPSDLGWWDNTFSEPECHWYIESSEVGPQYGKVQQCLANCAGGHMALVSDCYGTVWDGLTGIGSSTPVIGWKQDPDNKYYSRHKRCSIWGKWASGTPSWGSNTEKSCCDVTDAEIAECVRNKPKFTGTYIAGFHDCQTDAEEAARGCCLQ